MSTYLAINILVILFPLLLSFEKKLQFYKDFKSVIPAIVISALPFIIWDDIAALRGDWGFNPEHLIGIYIFSLPLEEVLFFFTIPYAIIFLYETGKYYLTDKSISVNKYLIYSIAFISVAFAFVFRDQYYTFTVLLFVPIILLMLTLIKNSLINSRFFWLFMLFTYIPFFVVNYLLTSLPIVTYSSEAIWGFRITTIPVEDFLYSFALIGLNLFLYTKLKSVWQKKEQ
ncbi:MAG: lycopene cyclase domain-containing protein [Ignavibacteriaceae bacterium]|jgi:lycopene cyclase domain-containing protein|nr:lycopene cyclase domain-containing protein [Ignavibacteriaceae bacterium]